MSSGRRSNQSVTPTTPIGKKLVQARLPFKSLTPSSPTIVKTPGNGDNTRKRKLSAVDDSSHEAKINRISGPSKAENDQQLEISDDESEPVVAEDQVIELTSDVELVADRIADPTEQESVPETPKGRKPRKSSQKSPVSKIVTPKQSSRKSSPRSIKKRKFNIVDEVATVSEESSFSIKLPLPKKRTKNESKIVSTLVKEKKNTAVVVLSTDNDDSSLSEDSSMVKSQPDVALKVISIDITSNSDDDRASLDVTSNEKTENEDVEMQISPKSVPIAASSKCSVQANSSTQKQLRSKSETEAKLLEKQRTNELREVQLNEEKEAQPMKLKKKERGVNVKDNTSNSEKDGASLDVTSNEKTENDVEMEISPKRVPIATSSKCSVETNRLTPKQLRRKSETEAKLLEKQRAKELREKKLNEEKEAKQMERDEKERLRKKEREDKEEQRRKEKEDKEEQKRKEKEDRDKKKQAELDAKNEERKKKEEQKEQERKQREEQKEQEKRKREEEKIAKEEAEILKKRKIAQAFTKFFVPSKGVNKKPDSSDIEHSDSIKHQNFMPFRIKDDMKLAPIVRRVLFDQERNILEDIINSNANCEREKLYLNRLRRNECLPGKDGKTWPNDDADILIIDDELEGAEAVIEEPTAKQNYRAKFFKFEENRRPAFYGTWRKSSKTIKARNPFVTDSKFFDYDVDSDDEWEEEEPGESLHGSDDEKDKESDDDYDIDNEFFVPHGHLSEEEVEDADDDNSPDAQKAKLKIIQKEFADEMKKKTEKIKPRLVGVIWQNRDGTRPSACPTVIWDMLTTRTMLFLGKSVSVKKPTQPESTTNSDIEDGPKKRIEMSDAVLADLIRLVHGSTNNVGFLIKEFRAFLAQQNIDQPNYKGFPNIRIRSQIKNLAKWSACPEEGAMQNKLCWYVPPEKREVYGVTDLTLPNTWQYILTKPKKIVESKIKEPVVTATVPADVVTTMKPAKMKPNAFSIAKFTKVLSEEDKKKQFSNVTTDKSAILTALPSTAVQISIPPTAKKRVNLMMSVPRGQMIPTPEKNALISKFLQSTSNSTNKEDVIKIDSD